MAANTDEDFFVSFDDLGFHGILYSRVHLRRLMQAGKFPPAYELSPNRIGWKFSDIYAWKANRPVRGVAA